MSSTKRPPVPTLHVLGTTQAPPAPLAELDPAAAAELLRKTGWTDDDAEEAIDDDDEPEAPEPAPKKRKLPPHRSGSQTHPYPSRSGPRARLNQRVPLELLQELQIFYATYLTPTERSEWLTRALRTAMARRRRRGPP